MADSSPAPAAPASPGKPLPGPNVLLLGEGGDGKTHSIRTLTSAGITPFVIFMEQGMETLGDMPPGSYHYKYIKAANANWAQLADLVNASNKMSYDVLLKMQDNKRSQYVGFMDLVTSMNKFKCDCCEKEWGDVAKWNTDRALVFDGLSGMSDLAKQMYVGMKPALAQNDWSIPQNMMMNLIGALVSDTRCTFVLLSHLDRETNELTGGTVLTVRALGKALAPIIPPKFSDVIRCERVGDKFTWNTAAANCVTKTRNLPLKSGLDPSFVGLIEGWKRKGGKIEATLV